MKPYEAPALTLVGSVTELTQAHHHHDHPYHHHYPPLDKDYSSSSDGVDYHDRHVNLS